MWGKKYGLLNRSISGLPLERWWGGKGRKEPLTCRSSCQSLHTTLDCDCTMHNAHRVLGTMQLCACVSCIVMHSAHCTRLLFLHCAVGWLRVLQPYFFFNPIPAADIQAFFCRGLKTEAKKHTTGFVTARLLGYWDIFKMRYFSKISPHWANLCKIWLYEMENSKQITNMQFINWHWMNTIFNKKINNS